MDGATISVSRFLQPMEVAVIVLFGEETRLSIDAALHKVLGQTGELDSWTAGHDYWLSLESNSDTDAFGSKAGFSSKFL
jgi:hypothetical protein